MGILDFCFCFLSGVEEGWGGVGVAGGLVVAGA